MNVKDIINILNLSPHPEGGYFKETYRATEITKNSENNPRNISTAIYFLLENEDKSHFHRIKSDEIWFHHLGETLEIIYFQNNKLNKVLLGSNIDKGENLQVVVPKNCWFAAHIKSKINYALVSCTVAPGFDFKDFELAEKQNLRKLYPNYLDIIEEFTIK